MLQGGRFGADDAGNDWLRKQLGGTDAFGCAWNVWDAKGAQARVPVLLKPILIDLFRKL